MLRRLPGKADLGRPVLPGALIDKAVALGRDQAVVARSRAGSGNHRARRAWAHESDAGRLVFL